MTDQALQRLRQRAQAVRARAQIRAWEYRQRHLAHGVWFRLRRALADAKEAYVITPEDAASLHQEGYGWLDCGLHLWPEKAIVFVDAVRLATIANRCAIRVGLNPEFLTATAVALLPFDETLPAHELGRRTAPLPPLREGAPD